MRVRHLLPIVASLAFTPIAQAQTASSVYTGSEQLDGITADYSITTNGTVGLLLPFTDITGYDLRLTTANAVYQLTPANSYVQGSFDASTTALSTRFPLYFFSRDPSFQATVIFYFMNTGRQLYGPAETYTYELVAQPSNNQPFATINGSVPEPATWAMIILGMGTVG